MSKTSYDLVVVGSGAAGLSAALFADAKGLRVLIVEKTGYVGGTTSYSGGVVWVPNSRQNVEIGLDDSIDKAEAYLDSTVSIPHEREARRTCLEKGPEAFAFLEDMTERLYYVRASNSPDYYPDVDGAILQGRAMTPLSCDGRLLGDRFRDIRPPLPELCLFGRQMLELMDVYHLIHHRRSLRSAIHTGRLVLRDLRDRLFYRKYGRGIRLTGGNALVANLYKHVLRRNIPVIRRAPLVDLVRGPAGISGVVIERDGTRQEISATCGVILAAGGFPWNKRLREDYLGQVPVGLSATSPDSTGDAISIAMAHGAGFDRGNVEGAFWTPVSLAKRKDGTTARFPHLMADRAKPGLIAVGRDGTRFHNEAENYHDFIRAMLERQKGRNEQFAHLICDAAFVGKYVFGAVPPLAAERRRAVRDGYLIEGATIEDLACKISVDPQILRGTIERHNADAAKGVDTEFGKGSNAYNRYLGDPTHQPNACLAPIGIAPFYAMKIHAGDIGTTHGLAADRDSRVLDKNGQPIEGLYACGSDRNSVMGGFYPSGGITIGPAITFAYLAVSHAAAAKAVYSQQRQFAG